MTGLEIDAIAAVEGPVAKSNNGDDVLVSCQIDEGKTNDVADDDANAGCEAQLRSVLEADKPTGQIDFTEEQGDEVQHVMISYSLEQSSNEPGGASEGEDDQQPTTEEAHGYLGYEEAVPQHRQRHRRRSSFLGHVMAWAGAVNQQFMDSDFQTQHAKANEGGVASDGAGRGATSAPSSYYEASRRASLDMAMPVSNRITAGDSLCDDRPRHVTRRCRSTDDGDSLEKDRDDEDLDEEVNGRARGAERRNSLHAMVERAMAYVNLRPDRNEDDLTPFGTRRDSLY